MATQKSRFLTRKQMTPVTGISVPYIYKLEEKGLFPKRVNLNPDPEGKPVTRWLRDEVEEWVEARLGKSISLVSIVCLVLLLLLV